MDKIALIPDLHCGDEDRRAIALACSVVAHFAPDRVIFLGDILDAGWASRWPQNQSEIKGIVKREKEAWYLAARAFIDAAPKAKRDAVPGNHDWRVVTGFAWSHPEFDGDEAVSLPHILKLKEFGIEWHEKPAAVFLAGKNFVATHGNRIAKHSGGSASLELCEEWWCSGISGHTHRMGQIYRTTHRGVFCWTEAGHLSNPLPKYVPVNKVAPLNWQQGIVLMEAGSSEFRAPILVPFWRKARRLRARFDGKEFME